MNNMNKKIIYYFCEPLRSPAEVYCVQFKEFPFSSPSISICDFLDLASWACKKFWKFKG